MRFLKSEKKKFKTLNTFVKKKKKKNPKVSFDQLKFMGTVGLKLMECSWILNIGFPILDVWEDMSRAGHKVGYDMWWETRSWSSTDSLLQIWVLFTSYTQYCFPLSNLESVGPSHQPIINQEITFHTVRSFLITC